MFIEDKAVQILRSQWHVSQHGDGERGLRLGQRTKIMLLLPLDLRPQTCRQIAEPLQCSRIVELPHGALVLRGQARLRHWHFAGETLELCQYPRVDLDPFPRNLSQGLGEITVEVVLLLAGYS